MRKEIQETLKIINKTSISSNQTLGILLSNVLFSKMAVFCNAKGDTFLLSSKLNNESIKNGLLITELVSVLHDLEESHSVYVTESIGRRSEFLLYNGYKCVTQTQFEGRFDVGNGEELLVEDGKAVIKNRDDNYSVLEGELVSQPLSDELFRILTAIIYPTERLGEFIKWNYQTEEKRQMKKANLISIISVVIAIIIAVSAPFMSVYWSNSHGEVTINRSQFKQILSTINHE
jgi:hypothetical protein